MENYIVYSIIVFSSFILLLYVYLLYEKLSELNEISKRKSYRKEIEPFIDKLFIKMEEDSQYEDMVNELKEMVKNEIKRKLVIERIIFYNELYSGSIRKNITDLCENTGLVDYEIKALKKNDKFTLAYTCKNLGEFRSKKAIRPLLKLKDSKNSDVRYHMLMALSKIGELEPLVEAIEGQQEDIVFSERSLTEIMDSFEGDKGQLFKSLIYGKNPFLSTIVIKSAGNYMDTELNEHIKDFIEDGDKEKRIAAIKSIGQNSDIRYLDKVIKRLSDEEWEVRSAAAKSLGRLGDNRALEELKKALSDSSWWVRYNAASSILELPKGLDYLHSVMKGEDKFAKDIIIAAMEDVGVLQEILMHENSSAEEKRELAVLLKQYILEKAE